MDGRTTTKKKSAAAAAAHPPWVVLDRIPRLVALTARSHTGEAHDLTFDFHDPPQPSLCKLRRTLFAGVPELCITAVDHTGSFLVSATEPGDQHQAGATAGLHEGHRFLFCDGTAGTARFLPIAPVALRRANVGLLANAAGHHVVAALHHDEGAADATMFICQPHIDNAWDQIVVAYPPGGHRPWKATNVICHRTRIYWVDPALGVLCYDPFAENSKLVYVPHPPGSHAHATSEGSRHVQLSREKIRCVQLEGAREATIIKVWTLSDDSSGGQFYWKPGFEIPVFQLEGDDLRSNMRDGVPKIVCMHPNRPTVVFLSVEQFVFFFLTTEQFVFEVDLMLGGAVIHQNMPVYAQDAGVIAVKFSVIPWTVILALARLLPATSQFRATLGRKGNAPHPSILNFDLGLLKPYRVNYCYVSAVDSKSGSLLIYEQHQRTAKKKTWKFDGYIILHSDESTLRLPTLAGMAEWHHNNAGIIINPSTDVTFVGLLHVSHHILHFWTSDNPNTWKRVSVSNAHLPSGYTWSGHGAHALDGVLYWIDLRIGFLTCNPFTEKRNELKFISLPQESVLPLENVNLDLNRLRCVNVSSGSIRFVDVDLINGFPFVRLWSCTNDDPGWTLEYTLDFSHLGKKKASPGFIHPDMSIIYFLQSLKAFAIDSHENVHEEFEFRLAKPPEEYKASLVHICSVPIQSLHHFPGV